MRYYTFLAAIAAIALSAAAPCARAADTILLGGVGSTVERFATDAPTMTLKGLPHDEASLEKAHWGYYRPWFRPWWGYGFNRPWFRPWFGYGFYRPWFGSGFYRPWFYRPWFGGFWPWYGISYAYAPTVAVDYGYGVTIPTVLSVTQRTPSAPTAWPPAGPEALPTPAQPGGFRYDGGPIRAVPPAGVALAPALDKPSAGRVAPTRLVSQPKPKPAYPAYGEPPVKPNEPTNNLRVNSTSR